MGTLAGFFLILLGGGVGLPIPEDLTLVAGGVLAHQHVLRLTHVIGVGLVAVALADWVIYLAGRRYGSDIVKLPVLARLVGGGRLDAVRSAVERHGVRAVFAARFVFGFRIATFLGAGMFGVPPYRFGVAEAAGTAIFVPAMATFGFLFADRAERVVRNVGHMQQWLLVVGLVALAGYLALRAWTGRTGLGGDAK